MVTKKKKDTSKESEESELEERQQRTETEREKELHYCYLSLSELLPTPQEDTAGIYFQWALIPPECKYTTFKLNETPSQLPEDLEWNRTDTSEAIEGDLMYSSPLAAIDFNSSLQSRETQILSLLKSRILIRTFLDDDSDEEGSQKDHEQDNEESGNVSDPKAKSKKKAKSAKSIEQEEELETKQDTEKGFLGETVVDLMPLVQTGELINQAKIALIPCESDIAEQEVGGEHEGTDESQERVEDEAATEKELVGKPRYVCESLAIGVRIHCDPQVGTLLSEGRVFTISSGKVSELPTSWLADPQTLVPIPEAVGKKQPEIPTTEPATYSLIIQLPHEHLQGDSEQSQTTEIELTQGKIVVPAVEESTEETDADDNDNGEAKELVAEEEEEDEASSNESTKQVNPSAYIEFENELQMVFMSKPDITRLKKELARFNEIPVKLLRKGPFMTSAEGLVPIPGQPEQETVLGTVGLGDLLSSDLGETVARLSLEYVAPIPPPEQVEDKENEESDETEDSPVASTEEEEPEKQTHETNPTENMSDVFITAEFNVCLNKPLLPRKPVQPPAIGKPSDFIQPRAPVDVPEPTVEEQFEKELGYAVQQVLYEYVQVLHAAAEKESNRLVKSEASQATTTSATDTTLSRTSRPQSSNGSASESTSFKTPKQRSLGLLGVDQEKHKQVLQTLNTSGTYTAIHRRLRDVVKQLIRKYFTKGDNVDTPDVKSAASTMDDPDLTCARAYSFVMQLVHRTLNNQFQAACNCSPENVEPWAFANPSFSDKRYMVANEIDYIGGLAVDLTNFLDQEKADRAHQRRVSIAEQALVDQANTAAAVMASEGHSPGDLSDSPQPAPPQQVSREDVAKVWCDYGMYCLRQGELGMSLAGECLRSSIALSMDFLPALAVYSMLLLEVGELEAAEAFLTNALNKIASPAFGASEEFGIADEAADVLRTLLYLVWKRMPYRVPEDAWAHPASDTTARPPSVRTEYDAFSRLAVEALCLCMPRVGQAAVEEQSIRTVKPQGSGDFVTVSHADVVHRGIVSGWTQLCLGRVPEAVEQLEAAIDLDPKNLLAWALLSDARYRQAPATALPLLRRLLAIASKGHALPSSRLAPRLLLSNCGPHCLPTHRFRLAGLELQEGRLDAANALFHESCIAQPFSPRSWQGLGRVLVAREDFEQAEKALSESNALDNLDPDTWALLAVSCHAQGEVRLGEANKCLEQALGLGISDYSLLHRLGTVYQRLGHSARAKEVYLRALHILPEEGETEKRSQVQLELARTLAHERHIDEAVECYRAVMDTSHDADIRRIAEEELEQVYVT